LVKLKNRHFYTHTSQVPAHYGLCKFAKDRQTDVISIANNDMQINTSKTKEMIIGSIDSISLSPLSTSSGTVIRVATFKLLGIHLDINLSWSVHINSITSNASKRLYFLKQRKRAGVAQNHLLHFYTAVIRPVLEYAAPVWHHLINRTQAQQLESIQNGLSI